MKLRNHLFFFKQSFFFRKKKDVYFYIFFITLSSLIFALMPLITQIYIRVLYPNQNINNLFIYSVFFIILFLFKLFIDVWTNKFSNKLFGKIEKQIKEIVFKNILKNKTKNISLNYLFLETYPKRYVLFLKKFIISNYINLVTLVFIFIIMIFFSFDIFKHLFWFFIIGLIYVFVFKLILSKHEKKNKERFRENNVDYLHLLENLKYSKKQDLEYLNKTFRRTSSINFEKDVSNRNSFVVLNKIIGASISFFRILFLLYFGYFIITQNQSVGNLIVGLLYITIFGKTIVNILTNSIYYVVTKSAIKNIHKIINESLK